LILNAPKAAGTVVGNGLRHDVKIIARKNTRRKIVGANVVIQNGNVYSLKG
jgi:hypothetical protein